MGDPDDSARDAAERNSRAQDAAERNSAGHSAARDSAARDSAARDSAARPAARNLTRGTVLAERVEVASSVWGKFMGLMGRRRLPPGDGLWLPASNGIHMFFMRIPIDAVFVGRPDREGSRRVLSIHRDLRPWTGIVPLVRGADGCLELPAGTIVASGTTVGDSVRIA